MGGGGSFIDSIFLQSARSFKPGDIIIFYLHRPETGILERFIQAGIIYKDITQEWHKRKYSGVTFFDKPGHMNAEGYQLTAKIIFEDLMSNRRSESNSKLINERGTEYLTSYLKSIINDNFKDEIHKYTAGIRAKYPPSSNNNGAIVMNCNPFTFGHRYLIETAASQVDRLYIFVVEEDKSFFKFQDRLEMIKACTQDLQNVIAVPGGRFIISAYTFPEYFMKDYVKSKNFDPSTDIETFCKYIAPELDIKIRFAGQEPFDPVTERYNQSMMEILPLYGMKFIEIPRFALTSGEIINATRVRDLIRTGDIDSLKKYVPEYVMNLIKNKYI